MRLFVALAGLLLFCCGGGRAQEPVQQDGPIHTLRVFTNLIQIPTLVLDDRDEPVLEKTHPRFLVTLDGGEPFAPTHVRLEGEDPIELGVLLDASGGERELLGGMAYELAAMVAEGALHPRDHVTIYAVDCKAVRTLADGPADKASLKTAVSEALKSAELHGAGKHQGACAQTVALRDAVLTLVQELGQLPGRRVLLAVTSGADGASEHTWEQVRQVTKRDRVTIFGLRDPGGPSLVRSGKRESEVTPGAPAPELDFRFDALCQTTGGMMLSAQEMTLKRTLKQFFRMLRGRYIVEFPRVDSLGSGAHLLLIRVVGKEYTIHPSEAIVPMADPRLKEDPTVLRPGVQPGAPAEVAPGKDVPKSSSKVI